jgi:tRNA G18 (ribose-2'-O)-methylase SpoU
LVGSSFARKAKSEIVIFWVPKCQWEAKQARKKAEAKKESLREKWIQDHGNFAFLVSENDVENVPSKSSFKSDDSLAHALAPYFDVQEKTSNDSASKSCVERLFIAEGTATIRILIQQSTHHESPIQLNSIFVKPCLLFDDPVHLLADVQDAMKRSREQGSDNEHHPGFQVLVGSESVLSKVAGFHIARGSLACGVVPKDRDEEWLTTFLRKKLIEKRESARILALDGICDNSNLGSMIRCASAFGVDVIVLSHDTCDCWYRRTIRVSMGHIFKVPIVRVKNLAAEIKKWSELNVTSYAAVLETDNLLTDIKHGTVPPSWCCVMGNEGNGISAVVRNAATQHIRIHIESGVDSLSVPIATGILLNGLREREEIL